MARKRVDSAVDGQLMDPDASVTSPELTVSDVDADSHLDQLSSVNTQAAADDDIDETGNEGESNANTNDEQSSPQTCQSSSNYTITCTVNIALAVLKEDPVKHAGRKRKKGSRHDRRGPKRKVYHIEYNLLPDVNEPTKMDVVMFGLSAEVLLGSESKPLHPWQEGDYVWFAWSQSVELDVSKELLFKMRSHKVTFRIWDSIDKVPVEARFCRPRAFSASLGKNLDDEEEIDDTKNMVDTLRSLYDKENPRHRTFQRESGPLDYSKPSNKACTNSPAVPDRRITQESVSEADLIAENGVAWVELGAVHLLAGNMSVAGRFLSPFGRVSDGLCSLTLDRPMISDELKVELKPLVITIHSASFLPCSPLPFHLLEQQCLPVYCQYKFLAAPPHKTAGHVHTSNIYFRDVNVIFTGLLNTGELLEYLRGPPLQIEVHDRDRKPQTIPKSSAIAAAGRSENYRPGVSRRAHPRCVEESVEPRHPHGVAELDLSDLVRGRRCLNYCLPIKCCHRVRWAAREDVVRSPEKRRNVQPVPLGRYFEANSMLNVRAEMTCPFDPDLYKNEALCPFGRIVYIFRCGNEAVRSKLDSEIFRINTATFQIDCGDKETARDALRTYKLSDEEKASTDLDFISGFHILDNVVHFFVLEGLKEQAIKQLWETVPMKLGGDVENQVTVLYNSSLSFSKRIYDTLDLALTSIHLHKPLKEILKHSHVYIRDMVPYPCLQAMLRINHIFQVKKLGKVVHCNLFPSAEMVLSLSREFGVIPKREERRPSEATEETQEDPHRPTTPRKMLLHLNTVNKSYIAWKLQQKLATKNFVQANIEKVHRASGLLQKPRPRVIVARVEDGQIAYNYSIQTLNSTSQARELLRKEMEKKPTRRFTYSQHYQSLTAEPVDVEAERKLLELRSRASWRTNEGFIFPGSCSSQEANRHPKQPDEARADELKKPWRENILHANTLSPTLNRARWAWSRRREDFDLYAKPTSFLDPATPNHIPQAEEALKQSQHIAVKKPEKDLVSGGEVQEKTQKNPPKHIGRKPRKHAETRATAERSSGAASSRPPQNPRARSDVHAQHGRHRFGHNRKPNPSLLLSQNEGSSHVSQKPQSGRTITNGLLQNGGR